METNHQKPVINVVAAVIKEGPEAVLNSKDENNPISTDINPPNIDSIIIC